MKVTVGGIVFRHVKKVEFFPVDFSERITVEIIYEDGDILDSIDVYTIRSVHIELETE